MKMKSKLTILFSVLTMPMVFAQSGSTVMGVSPALEASLAAAYMSPSTVMVDANATLKACINGTSVCTQGTHPLRLFQGNKEVTGFYDTKGNACTSANAKDCAFSVYATYTATCAPDSAGNPQTTCAKPATFLINYYVKNYNPQKGMTPLATISTEGAGRVPAQVPYSAIFAQQYSVSKCADLFPNDITKAFNVGTDAYGQVICGPDPNQGTIDTMKTKMCEMETAQVNTNGGTTTTCDPNITVVKLAGGSHAASECTGTLMDLTGTPVTNPTAANNQKLFCKFTASSCPSGWSPRDNWTTTVKKCADAVVHNAGGSGGGCWGSEGGPLASSIPKTCTNQHAFSNTAVEHNGVGEFTEQMPYNGGSGSCGHQNGGFYDTTGECGGSYLFLRWQDGSGSGNNRWYACVAWWNNPTTTVTADVSEIGCF